MNRKRLHSRSNQALNTLPLATQLPKKGSEEASIRRMLDTELKDKELFRESFRKIQDIKSLLNRHSSPDLMQQLNDIIDLIRGERVKAKITIEDLRKMVDFDGQVQPKETKQLGCQTDQILSCDFDDVDNQEVQTQKIEEVSMGEKVYEIYWKIVQLVDKMKVDYREVLPALKGLPQKYVLPDVQSSKDQYKKLTKEEILKLQKVFIGKLSSMLNPAQKPSVKKGSPKKAQRAEKEDTSSPKPAQNNSEHFLKINEQKLNYIKQSSLAVGSPFSMSSSG